MIFLERVGLFLTKKDKWELFGLFLFSIFIAFVETITISAAMPFIAVTTNFDIIKKHKTINYIYNLFNFQTPRSFILFKSMLSR